MDVILIAGLWLPASVWADTAAALVERGHHPIPLRLPGVDDGAVDATLDDQIDRVVAAVDGSHRPIVVGHSAAATLAWTAADRRPLDVSRVVLIGGFPSPAGSAYADFFPVVDRVMAFPGWGPFDGPDSVDLDEAARTRLADGAVPVPEGVARAEIAYSDERRTSVPVTLICPEFTPDDVREWMSGGDLAELERVEHLDLVDLDAGHWPMITRPVELARSIATSTGRS